LVLLQANHFSGKPGIVRELTAVRETEATVYKSGIFGGGSCRGSCLLLCLCVCGNGGVCYIMF